MYGHLDASDARQLELLLRDDTVAVSSRNRQVMVVQNHAQLPRNDWTFMGHGNE